MPTELSTILQLNVPIIVLVGERSMTMDDVLALAPGALLELAKGSEEELELRVNNRRIGSGSAVKVGENFGLQISQIGSPQERIAALGGA